MAHRLLLMIFGCNTKAKYHDQLEMIAKTYQLQADRVGVQVVIILESDTRPLTPSRATVVNLPTVDDSYTSNVPKTFLGLKWIKDQSIQYDFVLALGTDAYPNVPKLHRYLQDYNPDEPIYLGGHGDHRNFPVPLWFHSGGPGFILSRTAVDRLHPWLAMIPDDWAALCTHDKFFVGAGDMAIAYYLMLYIPEIQIIKTPGIIFSHCNHRGLPCHRGKQKIEDLLSCHSMNPKDMEEYYQLLESNNFYLDPGSRRTVGRRR